MAQESGRKAGANPGGMADSLMEPMGSGCWSCLPASMEMYGICPAVSTAEAVDGGEGRGQAEIYEVNNL